MTKLSFASREYEKAIKNADYNYQLNILSIEIKKLRERQRTIERAEARAKKEGIDKVIIDIAIGDEYSRNKKMIETLSQLREETKAQVRAQQKGLEIPKAKTYKGIHIFQRESARAQREKAEIPKASQRTLSAKIQRGVNEAVEEVIERMFFKGKFLNANYNKLVELSQKYKWVFDLKGFSLSDNFKSYIARNYAEFGSATAFDYFNEVIEEEISEEPETQIIDGVEYVDGVHTIEEYREAIAEIINALKP